MLDQPAGLTTYPPAQLPAATRLGPVRIAVTDAAGALPVWRDLVGLTVIDQSATEIVLGAGDRPLVILEPGAVRPVLPRTAGLYHVALHVPARRDLAVAIARLFQQRYRNSPTDHLVTETTYLWDADGNGIELTFETPWRGTMTFESPERFAVTADGKPHSGREAVDLQSLFGELRPGDDLNVPLPAGTRVGHVHLTVGDLDAAMRFYSEVIGFGGQFLNRRFQMADVTLGYVPHILAFNTWQGQGVPQPPPGTAGLRQFEIEVPDEAELAAVAARLAAAGAPVERSGGMVATADPAGNRLVIRRS